MIKIIYIDILVYGLPTSTYSTRMNRKNRHNIYRRVWCGRDNDETRREKKK